MTLTMLVLPPVPEQITEQIKAAHRALSTCSARILDALQPTPGPAALFAHQSHAAQRLADLSLITRRFYDNRATLWESYDEEDRTRPEKPMPGVPLTGPFAAAMQRSQRLVNELRVDFETFYVFADLFLDQFSIFAAYMTGLNQPEKSKFDSLVSMLDRDAVVSDALANFKETRWEDMLFLRHQLRYYRNHFIVHVRRPWQQGSSMMRYGLAFQLWVPTPVGWLDDAAVDQEIVELLTALAKSGDVPVSIEDVRKAPRDVLRRVHERIGSVKGTSARKRIELMRQTIGGATPDFSIVAAAVGRFAQYAATTFVDDALKEPQSINPVDPIMPLAASLNLQVARRGT